MQIDVDFAVDMLMKVYPENAVCEALRRADNLLKAGDLAAANKFTEAAAIIAERQTAEPDRPAAAAEAGTPPGASPRHG
jgi:hypothetical protein